MTLYAKLNEEFSHNFLASLMHGHGALQMFLVFISVAICSAHNASILTVQKPSVVFHLFTASVLINTLLIIGNSI